MNKKISTLAALAIIIASAGFVWAGVYVYQNEVMDSADSTIKINEIPSIIGSPKSEQDKTTVCTMEAKICPDGSSVGRTGPNCEFASCPSIIPNPNPSPNPAPETACNICKETDGGKNYYVLGSANPCASNDRSKCPPCGAWIDKCLDSNILLEYSCDDLNGEEYTCPNGCKDGRCN